MMRTLKEVILEDYEAAVKFIDENAFSLEDRSYK